MKSGWKPLGAATMLILASLGCSGSLAPKTTVLGIVSEASAAEMARALDRLEQEGVRARWFFRTPAQVAALDDVAWRQLWRRTDAVVVAGIFGDGVPALVRAMAWSKGPRTVWALSSDLRLVRASRQGGQALFTAVDNTAYQELTANPGPDEDYVGVYRARAESIPALKDWLWARAHWQARGDDNLAGMLRRVLRTVDDSVAVVPPRAPAPVRYYRFGTWQQSCAPLSPSTDTRDQVLVFDLDTGDRAGLLEIHEGLHHALTAQGLEAVSVFARWGQSANSALQVCEGALGPRLSAVIVLQDFIIGGGAGREQIDALLARLNVPLLKGVRLTKQTRSDWLFSNSGLTPDAVHYQLAMPEAQGVGQPMVVSALGEEVLHSVSGLRYRAPTLVASQIKGLAARVRAWQRLQTTPNADKKIAIVYYNHPPGRHNVGADNLDVPASLWNMLQTLQREGYHVGTLPESPEALLEQIQRQGVNVPQDAHALAKLASQVEKVSLPTYRTWFRSLPAAVQQEMQAGPLGYLHGAVNAALRQNALMSVMPHATAVIEDVRHTLEGSEHPEKKRALNLLEQLEDALDDAAQERSEDLAEATPLVQAIQRLGIEGLRGWGAPPGQVMVHEQQILIPGLRFGNVFIGPQPPRGWELDEELLHANLSFAPTHQYAAFYFWLREAFGAHGVVHLGRHSTHEFLPRRRAGLAEDDYPPLLLGSLPNIYPYIVDGVGEGIQAKRRGMAVVVDHLTPPLRTTPLYDRLLQLRQLVESYEAQAGNAAARQHAVARLRESVQALNLRSELVASMAPELKKRDTTFEAIDDDLLVHEVGHYLTTLQERFMPSGLHVFGQAWMREQVDMMLASMDTPEARASLEASPGQEMGNFLAALSGGFVPPGKGNDPIRTPAVLPTGRNFHALSSDVLPTSIAMDLGRALAARAREDDPEGEGSEAVILWASDVVRDEGVMVAFGLDMLGVRPVWNSRGIVNDLERVPLIPGRVRRDVVFSTSGLFRDLYGDLLVWLDKAVLLALTASERPLLEKHPELSEAWAHATARLGGHRPGSEPVEKNRVAQSWLRSVQQLREQDLSFADAGLQASLRLFGDAPGSYSTGVNRLAERSGAWRERTELAATYLQRTGHAFGIGLGGRPSHRGHKAALQKVQRAYFGRSSNLYGLVDNNDGFDYLGGLGLGVESLTGSAPASFVVGHANPKAPTVTPLATALLSELRGRFLNPAWIQSLLPHGYAGARTMNANFFENIWGWQVTRPDVVEDWVWEDIRQVYVEDRHGLGLEQFWNDGPNVHVLTNLLAIFLTAAQKGFWETSEATLQQLAQQFAANIATHGLPGSGHTAPDHPVFEFVQPHLDADTKAQLQAILDQARLPAALSEPGATAVVIEEADPPPASRAAIWFGLAAGCLLLLGAIRGARSRIGPRS